MSRYLDHEHPAPWKYVPAEDDRCRHERTRLVRRWISGTERFGWECKVCGYPPIGQPWLGKEKAAWEYQDDLTLAADWNKNEALRRRSLTDRLQKTYSRYAARQAAWEWYNEYLQSDQWASIRQKVLAQSGGRCEICNAKAEHAHHYTYKNVGNENIDDLMAVCRYCHERIHAGII